LTCKSAGRSARRVKPLVVPLTTGCDGKGDREKHDSNNTDDVREVVRNRP
jgi:hypothetical protein